MELALTTGEGELGSWELKTGEERLGIVKSFRGNSRSFEIRTGREDEVVPWWREEIEMEREGMRRTGLPYCSRAESRNSQGVILNAPKRTGHSSVMTFYTTHVWPFQGKR